MELLYVSYLTPNVFDGARYISTPTFHSATPFGDEPLLHRPSVPQLS